MCALCIYANPGVMAHPLPLAHERHSRLTRAQIRRDIVQGRSDCAAGMALLYRIRRTHSIGFSLGCAVSCA